jgi:putative transposase
VQRTFKYRLYPSAKQRKALFATFKFCRLLYNSALQERISFYKTFGKSRKYTEQAAFLPEIKADFADELQTQKSALTSPINKIHSQVLQQVLKQLDVSYQNFFRRVKEGSEAPGFPRFKNRDRFRSICFPQVSTDLLNMLGVKLTDNKLKIFGIDGDIRIVFHRPFEGIAKQCRIVKKNDNFYLCISCDNIAAKPLPRTNKTIGIDLGIVSFVTLDDGTKFHHPRPYQTAKEKLAYYQRKLALKQKGSLNRLKVKNSLSKVHEKISNIREDFQHKLANKIIAENDTIIIEKLNIKSMLEAKGFEVNKSNIQEASWGKFVSKLIYKAESAGRSIREVNPMNTSKTCSHCGKINKELTLRDREFRCEACGFAMDRDRNAAINIRRLGTSPAIRDDLRSLHL